MTDLKPRKNPCPPELDMSRMTDEQIMDLVHASERDIAEGNYMEAKDAFADFKRRHVLQGKADSGSA